MRALVMGGSEFVGKSMAKYLIEKKYDVDVFTRGIKPIEYKGVRRHLKGDRRSINDLRKNIYKERYDYVFDISAYTREDVEKLVSVLNRDVLKRYVFCSSGAVYIPSYEAICEEFTRGENKNWGKYGLDKKEAEDYLLDLYRQEGVPVTMFRPTYIYGEENNLYREGYLFDRINNGLDIPIPHGDKETQFVHIFDVVKTFESALHTDRSIGQAYNLTNSDIVTWYDLVKTAMKVVNKEVNIKKVDSEKIKITAREYFPFRNVTYLLDTRKLREHGLHLPDINLLEGMKRTYKWYSKEKPLIGDSRMNKIDLVMGV